MPEIVPQTQNGSLTDHQIGTNDTFSDFTSLYGDALSMYDDSQGGNDALMGADYSPENERRGRDHGVFPRSKTAVVQKSVKLRHTL